MKETRTEQSVTSRTIGRATTLALAFAASVVIAACGGDSTTGPGGTNPTSSPVGTYSVSSVNGKGLPVAVFNEATYKIEVTGGSIALTSDGKFITVTNFRQTIPDDISLYSDSTFGTWALSGAQINLTNAQDTTVKDQGSWAGTQLTFALTDGKTTTTYVYTKK